MEKEVKQQSPETLDGVIAISNPELPETSCFENRYYSAESLDNTFALNNMSQADIHAIVFGFSSNSKPSEPRIVDWPIAGICGLDISKGAQKSAHLTFALDGKVGAYEVHRSLEAWFDSLYERRAQTSARLYKSVTGVL